MVHLFPFLLPFFLLFQPVLTDYTPFTLYIIIYPPEHTSNRLFYASRFRLVPVTV